MSGRIEKDGKLKILFRSRKSVSLIFVAGFLGLVNTNSDRFKLFVGEIRNFAVELI